MWKRDTLIRHDDYEMSIHDIDIMVRDNVFTPDVTITNSTNMLLEHMPDVAGKYILDIWCWTWIVWLKAGLQWAKTVVASDINRYALKNTQENVEKHQLGSIISVVESNLFDAIAWTFDYVFANLPILDEVWWAGDIEATSTNSLIQRFLREQDTYLNVWWKSYLTRASFSEVAPVRSYMTWLGIDYREYTQKKDWFTRYLFELLQS